ncbi:MAG: type II secretion system F family protein [Pseudomonadota bacterium]
MPLFAYEGQTSGGESRKGEIEAKDDNAARQKLRQMQISPTKLAKKGTGLNMDLGSLKMPKFLQPGIKTKDLVVFTRQFATMIDSGLPLVQCLEIQSQQAPSPAFRDQLKVIKEAVESGSTFADALRKFPDTFDELFQNLVAAGEVGGILDTILNRLATHLEKADKLKRQIKGAMTYPTIVTVVAVGAAAVLLVKVVPTIETMFAEMGATLPAPTQLMVTFSRFLRDNGLYIIGGLAIAIVALRYFYKSSQGRVVFDTISLKLPVFGDLITKSAVARFSRTLGTMVSSGVPILDALEICGKTSGNRVIENAISTARDAIAEGRTIAEPLLATKVFPDMVCQMISVGEATGALDVMLNKIADFYEEEVDDAVDNLTAMIEPIIMVVMGIGGGWFVIAMYLPIFTMASNIH